MGDSQTLTPLDNGRGKGASAPTSALALVTFFSAVIFLGLILWISLAGSDSGGEPQVILALGANGPDIVEQTFNPTDSADSTDGSSAWTTEDQLDQYRDQTIRTIRPPRPTNPGLIEQTVVGPLPAIAADGRKPMEEYAAPFSDPDGLPHIAILIRGLGLSAKTTQAAIDTLPSEVTLSFVPYATDLQDWVEKARLKGHEVMLELPMEPYGYPDNDPGPYTLLTSADPSENIRRLHWLLSRFTGYVGVTNYLGEKFISDKDALEDVVRELETRGLLFIDDSTSARSMLGPLANKHSLYWNRSNRLIDRASAATIDKDLARLEAHARKNALAVGTGFAFPATIETIAQWAQSLEEKDLRLAPISTAVDPSYKE